MAVGVRAPATLKLGRVSVELEARPAPWGCFKKAVVCVYALWHLAAAVQCVFVCRPQ